MKCTRVADRAFSNGEGLRRGQVRDSGFSSSFFYGLLLANRFA